jgi:agmatine deiminase
MSTPAASYINFFFCNGGAVVPTFGDRPDAAALEMLQRLLPERRVVGVQAREILLGGENIHYTTQQQPWFPCLLVIPLKIQFV